jgi:predicted nucleic acid-binding protein
MPRHKNRLLIDSGVAVAWDLRGELHEPQAREVLLDWQSGTIHFCCSDQLPLEITSALLKALRRGRTTPEEARQAIVEILAVRFTVFRATKPLLLRPFEIAEQNNQKLYNCVPVAMAERHRTEFWTADERLYNALHGAFPFVYWLAHYLRSRS